MKLIKSIILTLVIIFLSFVLYGCSQNKKPEEIKPVDVNIISGGVSNFVIIHSDKGSDVVINAANEIRNAITEATGVKPDLATDWIRKNQEHDPNTREILIGYTNYAETQSSLCKVGYGDFIVEFSGNKLIVAGWTDQATIAATEILITEIKNNAEQGSLFISSDIKSTGTKNEKLNILPVYTGGCLKTTVNLGEQNQLYLIGDTNKQEYEKYLTMLEEIGYAKYTQNNISNNCFTTYINKDYIINAGYYDYEESSRIIIEPYKTVPILESENTSKKVCDTKLTLMGLEYDYNGSPGQNGLGIVIRLEDGSFIIVDGGYDRDLDAKRLMMVLKEQAPDPNNIVISAWIITHAHGDHVGAFIKFTDYYQPKVTLKRFICSFPPDYQEEGKWPSIAKTCVAKYSGIEYYKAHTGQKYFISNAEIEILFTPESFEPSKYTIYNTCSVIFTLKIEGQRIMITGDATDESLSIIADAYGDYLKSDIIQATHHGAAQASSSGSYSGIIKAYTLMKPSIVLWPTGKIHYDKSSGFNYTPTEPLIGDISLVKENIVAYGDGIYTMTLPYLP